MDGAARSQRIFVYGPYTHGDVAANVRNAILAANELRDHGFYPFIPHLSHYWHTLCPRPYEEWLVMDLEWLRVCHALLRLPGESSGADKEVEWCIAHEMPVFYEMADLLAVTLEE